MQGVENAVVEFSGGRVWKISIAVRLHVELKVTLFQCTVVYRHYVCVDHSGPFWTPCITVPIFQLPHFPPPAFSYCFVPIFPLLHFQSPSNVSKQASLFSQNIYNIIKITKSKSIRYSELLKHDYSTTFSVMLYKYKYKWEFVERGLQIVQGR